MSIQGLKCMKNSFPYLKEKPHLTGTNPFIPEKCDLVFFILHSFLICRLHCHYQSSHHSLCYCLCFSGYPTVHHHPDHRLHRLRLFPTSSIPSSRPSPILSMALSPVCVSFAPLSFTTSFCPAPLSFEFPAQAVTENQNTNNTS